MYTYRYMALHIWRDFPQGAKMTMMTTTPSLAFSFPPHVYILPGECQRDLKSHDQNDHDLLSTFE